MGGVKIMTLIKRNDVNQIFAEQAPTQDQPASFENYPLGWDESRKNEGKPKIPQFNFLQQRTDQNLLYIHQQGAALPFHASIEYAEGAIVLKDGVLSQKKGSSWIAVGGGGSGGGDGISTVESIADLNAIKDPKNGQVVFVKFTGSNFKYNIAAQGSNKWELLNKLPSLLDFGAKADGSDDSKSISAALLYSSKNNVEVTGLGKTYACHSVLFDNDVQFRDAKLICNKLDTDLISVLECSSYNQDKRWLTNIRFSNIHIDGERKKHIKVKDTTSQEDGGRSGFRFIRPCDGVYLDNCSGINCASDGIIFFPHGDQSQKNNTVKNVYITDSTFNGNRRHGGSANSTNGMFLTNVVMSGNGLDIDPSAPLNSGLRGDVVSSGLYGSGFDVEEYALDVQSTNMNFNNCEMLGNAKSGLLVLTVGSPSQTNKSTVFVRGGKYDRGVSANAEQWSILVTPVTDKSYPSFSYVSIVDVDARGGSVGSLGADILIVNGLINGTARALEMTNLYAHGAFSAISEASSSNVFRTFEPNTKQFNYNPSTNLMQINTSQDSVEFRGGIRDVSGGGFKLSAYRGVERGSINFRMNANTGGTDIFFSHFGAETLAFRKTELTPSTNGSYNLGRRGTSFGSLFSQKLTLSSLSIFQDNALAISGGLLAGDVYRNSAGALFVVF